jgi:mannose-6-phosphate isomerase-like protein (cupin superfamily)
MATIDYYQRLDKGEKPAFPPVLHKGSKLSDYAQWLNRDDMVLSPDFKDMYAKIIGSVPGTITAIAWLRNISVQEVHDNEIEKFLIVEGTCDIIVGEKAYNLRRGDYFEIPLHKVHTVKVSEDILCKVILQRVAA